MKYNLIQLALDVRFIRNYFFCSNKSIEFFYSLNVYFSAGLLLFSPVEKQQQPKLNTENNEI